MAAMMQAMTIDPASARRRIARKVSVAHRLAALTGGRPSIATPPLFPWQEQVVSEARRYNVICVGRRAGKTALAINRCVAAEVLHHPVGWFSPTYKMMTEVWRETVEILMPITRRKSEKEYRIELTTGGVLEFWSLDNSTAGRSRRYKRVVIDEAAFVPDLTFAWNNVIRPTLADLRGDAWLMSTPKGRNGFWQLWQRGQDDLQDAWRSWQMPSDVNPLLSREELAEIRATYPEHVIAQEYDAQFLDDAGGVFRRVLECATAALQERAIPGRAYVAGVDVAMQQDYTVVTVIDTRTREQVYIDRFNRVGYEALEDRLHAVYELFNVQTMIIEDNSVGLPVIDHLRGRGMAIQPFHTSAQTKAPLIQDLQSAFEHGALRILNDPTQIMELQVYEGKRLASGMSYSAPPGMHDDMVMALALAYHALDKRRTGVLQYA